MKKTVEYNVLTENPIKVVVDADSTSATICWRYSATISSNTRCGEDIVYGIQCQNIELTPNTSCKTPYLSGSTIEWEGNEIEYEITQRPRHCDCEPLEEPIYSYELIDYWLEPNVITCGEEVNSTLSYKYNIFIDDGCDIVSKTSSGSIENITISCDGDIEEVTRKETSEIEITLPDGITSSVTASYTCKPCKKGCGDFEPFIEVGEITYDRDYVLCVGTSDKNKNFTKVQYLESDGNQYIDLNITPDSETGIYIHATSGKNINDGDDKYIVGLRNDNGDTRWCIGNPSRGWYYGYGSHVYGGTSSEAECQLNYKNNNKFIVNGQEINLPSLPFTPLNNIRLFGSSGVNDYYTKYKGRIYSIKVSQGTEEIMDLIPIMDSDGYAKLYDTISGNKYSNDGRSGEFIPGPPIIENNTQSDVQEDDRDTLTFTVPYVITKMNDDCERVRVYSAYTSTWAIPPCQETLSSYVDCDENGNNIKICCIDHYVTSSVTINIDNNFNVDLNLSMLMKGDYDGTCCKCDCTDMTNTTYETSTTAKTVDVYVPICARNGVWRKNGCSGLTEEDKDNMLVPYDGGKIRVTFDYSATTINSDCSISVISGETTYELNVPSICDSVDNDIEEEVQGSRPDNGYIEENPCEYTEITNSFTYKDATEGKNNTVTYKYYQENCPNDNK